MNKKNQDLVRLGKLIRNAREEANLTQEELASKAEVDRSYIGGIERGERNVSFLTLVKIAKSLETSVSTLQFTYQNES
jgi:transcriptional regulator with XRE-family HTH domain